VPATRSLRGRARGGCAGLCRAGCPRSDPGARRPLALVLVPPVCGNDSRWPVRAAVSRPEASCSGGLAARRAGFPALLKRSAARLRGRGGGTGVPDPMTRLNPLLRVGGTPSLTPLAPTRPRWAARRFRQRALDLLERVGSPASASISYPHEFSGALRQRLSIALAMPWEPPGDRV